MSICPDELENNRAMLIAMPVRNRYHYQIVMSFAWRKPGEDCIIWKELLDNVNTSYYSIVNSVFNIYTREVFY